MRWQPGLQMFCFRPPKNFLVSRPSGLHEAQYSTHLPLRVLSCECLILYSSYRSVFIVFFFLHCSDHVAVQVPSCTSPSCFPWLPSLVSPVPVKSTSSSNFIFCTCAHTSSLLWGDAGGTCLLTQQTTLVRFHGRILKHSSGVRRWKSSVWYRWDVLCTSVSMDEWNKILYYIPAAQWCSCNP